MAGLLPGAPLGRTAARTPQGPGREQRTWAMVQGTASQSETYDSVGLTANLVDHGQSEREKETEKNGMYQSLLPASKVGVF